MTDTKGGTVSDRATTTFTVAGPCERIIDSKSDWMTADQNSGRRPTDTSVKIN